jgi:hypothetical protein
LVNVDGCGKLKYLPPSEVKTLQLKALGCNTNTILVREEYLFTTEKLKEYGPDIGGIILTGHPGSGKGLLQNDMGRPTHVLITCRKIRFSVLSFAAPP